MSTKMKLYRLLEEATIDDYTIEDFQPRVIRF